MTVLTAPWHETLAGRACGLADIAAEAVYLRRIWLARAAKGAGGAAIACGVLLAPQPFSPLPIALHSGAVAILAAEMLLPHPLAGVPGEELLPMGQRRKFASFADWRDSSPLVGPCSAERAYRRWAIANPKARHL
ncbi:hypothetical protein FACS1894186_3540 [Alphaproteobacteria bacterium]|nr:hypothetical protein FACS1894186_3540 [Alphaproteobacteria bacterium]